MKKIKGFTVIELLCTIIILSIVFIIAVPRVTDLLVTSKKEAHEDSLAAIEKAISLYATSLDLGVDGTLPLTITIENEKYYYQFSGGSKTEGNILEIKGKVPDGGTIVIYADKSYDYSIYNKSLGMCTRNDNTNYLTITNTSLKNNGYFEITDFDGNANKTVSVGTINATNLKENDILLLDYDAEYTDAIYDIKKADSGIYLKGTSGTKTLSFEKIKLNGIGVYHASSTQKLTSAQIGTTFNASFIFDYYTEGSIKISNVKLTRKDTRIDTEVENASECS